MENSGSSFWFPPLPIFDGEDYNLWQKKMKTFFISQGLWNLVQNGEIWSYEEERKDARALYYIQQAVAPTIFRKIVYFLSAKTAWDFLETEYNTEFLEDIDFHAIEIPENLDTPICTGLMYYGEVRRHLRDLNPSVYTPQLISIGPLHHGRPELANWQIRKFYYANGFLNRIQKPKYLFVSFIIQHEERIRGCYSKQSELSSSEYVEMILLDSFFILEFFLTSGEISYNPDNSSMHNEVPYMKNILLDLMLFENQLPLRLLFEIYNIAFYDGEDFSVILTSFFKLWSYNFEVNILIHIEGEELMKQLHFTDLVRRFKCVGILAEMKKPKPIRTLRYAARKLSESKLKFFGIACGSLTGIRFRKRVLNLPKFTVDNTTERVYGNLIGLEQCDDQFKDKRYICSYILFLGYLMKNSDDVAVLIEDGVIINELGSNQAVVDMLNIEDINSKATVTRSPIIG